MGSDLNEHEPLTVLSPNELRAKAARLVALAATLPPGPDAETLRKAADYYLDLAQRLESV
jgi:hypothetical protein